jgi:hypothetical protein
LNTRAERYWNVENPQSSTPWHKSLFGDVLSAKRTMGIVFYAVISNSEKYRRQVLEADHSMTLS